MKEYISEEEWKQVIAILGIEQALAVRIGPRERVVPGLESRWLMEVDVPTSTGPGCTGRSPDGRPYGVTTFYVPVMLPGDEARRQRRLAEGERKIAELVHGKRVEHAFLPDALTDADVTVQTNQDGKITSVALDGAAAWSHCGSRVPHTRHTHTVTFMEGSYPNVVCPGTPADERRLLENDYCAPEEGKLST